MCHIQITNNSCIVLPLTQGGGTSLKTAEALVSAKHIGDDCRHAWFRALYWDQGVHLADDPTSFKRALRFAMESEPLRLSEQEIAERRSVLWESCLDPLVPLIDNLTEKTSV